MGEIAKHTFPLFVEKRPEGRPNVVLLFTDEQRYDTIGALGCDYMVTPNLDRLVREGCAFTHACTPNPVCVPARHNLLTGLYSRDTGMSENQTAVMPPSIPRLPQILADAGYHCEVVGKMHFQPARTHHGFHRMQVMAELFRNVGDDDFAMYLRSVGLGHIRNIHGVRNLLYDQPQRSLLPEEHHGTTWVGDRAADCVRRNRNRPFFLWAGWIAPHPPFAPPADLADLYKDAPLPEPTPQEEDANPRLQRHRLAMDDPTPGKIRRVRELYAASVTHIDRNVGKVIEALEETGQLDNTLVIFTSDHGDMLGDNGAWSKQVPNDPSVRIPFIMRCPGRIEAGTVRHDYADLVDILPTVLDACGVDYPSDIEFPGESLLISEGCGAKDRSVHYMENSRGRGRVISLRGQRHKYNYWFDGGREELYDMEEEPAEIHNLLQGARATDQQEAYREMKERLTACEARCGHSGTVKEGRLVPSDAPEKPTWPPGVRGLNWQFHMHPFNMRPEEAATYNSEKDEVLAATKDEPTLDLAKLDLDYYLSAGGDPELVEEIRRRR